jgi:PAS domain S-box-containing protein
MVLMSTSLLTPSLVTTYLFLCVLAALGMLLVAVDLWRSRTSLAGRLALATVGCVLGWLLAVMCSLLSPTISLALFWHETIRFVFVVLLPPLVLLYFASYFGVPRFSRRLVTGVGLIPGLTILFDLTNGRHHWFLASYTMQRVGPYFVRAAWAPGPWFPIYTAMNVVSTLVVCMVLVLAYQPRVSLYRAQVWLLVLALVPPALLLVFDTFSRSPLALFGLSPIGFAATALLLDWALRHERVLDLVPVAREIIFAGMADPVLVLDARGRVIDLNLAAEQVVGRAAETVLGTEIERLLARRLADLQGLQAPGGTHGSGSDLATLDLERDGEARRYDVRVSPFGLRAGRVDGHLVVLRDVTALRQAGEHLAEQASQLEAVFEAITDGVNVYDLEGHFVRANSALHHIYGFAADGEYPARPLDQRAQQLQFFDDQGQLLPAEQWPFRRVLRGEVLSGACAMETRVQALDGRDLWVSITGAPVRAVDGHITGVVLVTRDVTARRVLERHMQEQASELEAIVTAMSDGVAVYDQEGHLVRANPALAQLFGELAHGEYLTLPLPERAELLPIFDEAGRRLHLDQWPHWRVLRGEVLSGPTMTQTHIQKPEGGRELWVETSGAPIHGRDGQITGAVLISRDITARRALDQQVAEQASQLAAIFEAQADVVVVYDQQRRLVRGNRAWEAYLQQYVELLGVSSDPAFVALPLADQVDWLNQRIQDAQGRVIPVEDLPTSRALGGEMVTGEQAVDERVQSPDGREMQLSVTAAPVRNREGRIIGAVVVGRDVTARRHLERQLAERERQYRTLVENAPDAIIRFDPALRHVYVSPRAEAMLSIPAQTRLGKTYAELGLPSSVYGPWERALREVFATGEPCAFDTTSPFGRGAWPTHYYRVRYIPEFGADGSVASVLGITSDITELRQTEHRLAEQERLFRTLAENSPDIISRFDRELRYRYVGPQLEAATGLPAQALLGKTDAEAGLPAALGLPAERYAVWAQALTRAVATGERGELEFAFTGPTGTRFYLMRLIPEQAEDGSVASVLTVTTDVTTLKRTEQALRQSEERFAKAFQASPAAMTITSRTSRQILDANQAASVLTGYRRHELLGQTVPGLGAVEPSALQDLREHVRGGMQAHDVPLAVRTKAGEVRSCLVSTESIWLGHEECLITFLYDITALQRTEKALRVATGAAEAARQEEQRRREDAERRQQIAESLRGVLSVLNSRRELREVHDYIVGQVEALLGSAAAVIYGPDRLVDITPSGVLAEALRVQAAHGLRLGGHRPRPHQRLPFAAPAIQQAMMSEQPVVLVDGCGFLPPVTATDLAAGDAAISLLQGTLPAPYQTVLVIPIRVPDGLYGCLLLFYTQPCRFAAEDVALAQAYADQVAQAITNARLQVHLEQEAAAAERTRLARELHDTVTQDIFSANLIAQSLPWTWQTHRAKAEVELQQLHTLTQSAQAGLRALLLELRPGELEHTPLADALRKLGAAMSSRAGGPITVDVDSGADPEPSLPVPVKVAFYRVAQEALMNAAKYAHAHAISVRLRTRGTGQVELEIADDGQGFDPQAIPPGHFGLAIMRERAQAVGAQVQVRSTLDQGTQVMVAWQRRRQAMVSDRAVSD